MLFPPPSLMMKTIISTEKYSIFKYFKYLLNMYKYISHVNYTLIFKNRLFCEVFW